MSRSFTFASAVLALGLVPAIAGAQNREVTGKVTRTVGDVPVAGATIVEIGGQGVAQSGNDGTFRISVGLGDVRLLVRAIGFQRKEVAASASTSSVSVALDEDPFKLEAVVVTGQATTLERRNATTATVQVSGADLNRAPAQALEQALQGKVPGATISMNSGAPGGGGQMQIRGATSILGQGQPLFVVDGVIISNDAISDGANSVTAAGGRGTPAGIGGSQDALVNRLADLNLNEIESIEVLKSAAATAMYGSRATNGVVVIKTKRGTPGSAPQFNLTSRLGRSVAYRLLGTREFTTTDQVRNLAYGNGSTSPDTGLLTQLYPSGQIPFTHDYEKEFYKNPDPSYEVTGSFSGGTPATQYYLNLTGRREAGIAPNTGARLYALRANVDQAFINGKIRVHTGLNVTRNSLNRGLSNNDNTNTSPIYGFAYTPGVVNLDSVDATGSYVRNPFNGGGNGVSNPFETFRYLRLNELTFRQIGDISATWSALNAAQHQISVTATGGFDRAQVSADLFSPSFVQYEAPTGSLGGRCAARATSSTTISSSPATGRTSRVAACHSRPRPDTPGRHSTTASCGPVPEVSWPGSRRVTVALSWTVQTTCSGISETSRSSPTNKFWLSTNGWPLRAESAPTARVPTATATTTTSSPTPRPRTGSRTSASCSTK